MRKSKDLNGKVLRLKEFVDEKIQDLNVIFRLHNIRLKHQYEDINYPCRNLIEKIINFRSNINLDNDLQKSRKDLLKSDFHDFLKLMDSTMIVESNENKIVYSNTKCIENKFLKRIEIDILLNGKNNHKHCICFHCNNEGDQIDLSKTHNFKKMIKAQSISNMSNTIKEIYKFSGGASTKTSFDKLLRNTTNENNFVYSDSQKISLEKAKFLEKRKDFTRKKQTVKKIAIFLPSLKINDSNIEQGILDKNYQKEEFYVNDRDDPEIYKKNLILPKEESMKPQKKTPSKKRNSIIIGSILVDNNDNFKKETIIEKVGSKSNPIKLKKYSSVNFFDISKYNKVKEPQEKFISSNNLINQIHTKSDIHPKKKCINPSEKWEKERKNSVNMKIKSEFVRLKSVKNEIHKTFDSALAELYEKAINKTKRTGESHQSHN